MSATGATIYDDIRKLPVSRQRKYQLRNKKEGLCQICAAPSEGKARCEYCKYMDRQRHLSGHQKQGESRNVTAQKG